MSFVSVGHDVVVRGEADRAFVTLRGVNVVAILSKDHEQEIYFSFGVGSIDFTCFQRLPVDSPCDAERHHDGQPEDVADGEAEHAGITVCLKSSDGRIDSTDATRD